MTTRREVLLALARDHDQDVIVAEVVDGVCLLRRPGDVLPAVGIPVVPSSVEHVELLEPVRCRQADPHAAHIVAATEGTFGRCPGVTGLGRRR